MAKKKELENVLENSSEKTFNAVALSVIQNQDKSFSLVSIELDSESLTLGTAKVLFTSTYKAEVFNQFKMQAIKDNFS